MNASDRHLPNWIETTWKKSKRLVKNVVFKGNQRFCPVCGKSSRRFQRFSNTPNPRDDSLCPYCCSLERHRLLWLFLEKKTDLFNGESKKILHVAPEPCLEKSMRARLGDGYLTADLFSERAMVKMDITKIDYPDSTFDVIYCSHVLEHVEDDKKAIREFLRVLKPTGWAILLVPITAEKTYEDPTIVDPLERLKAFGQEDHLRRFGPDFVGRLRESGFHVSVATTGDIAKGSDAIRMGLTEACGEIFFCTKPN